MDEQTDAMENEDNIELHPDDIVSIRIDELFNAINAAKPGDRSELDRRYQILKTDLEKLRGYFDTYIARRDYWPLG